HEQRLVARVHRSSATNLDGRAAVGSLVDLDTGKPTDQHVGHGWWRALHELVAVHLGHGPRAIPSVLRAIDAVRRGPQYRFARARMTRCAKDRTASNDEFSNETARRHDVAPRQSLAARTRVHHRSRCWRSARKASPVIILETSAFSAGGFE